MVIKVLFSLLSILFNWIVVGGFSEDFNIENGVLTSVNDKEVQEVRIYKEKGVTSIGENAFDDCKFAMLMVSSTVQEVKDEFPTSLSVINFTGSEEELKFDIPSNVQINYYACDEGFMNFWTTYIRPNITGSICNVKKEDYLKMKVLYSNLNTYDFDKVNTIKDGTGTIGNSVAYLDNYFSVPSRTNNTEKDIPQSVMITFVLIIASIGMTSIGIFYVLKDKQIIN